MTRDVNFRGALYRLRRNRVMRISRRVIEQHRHLRLAGQPLHVAQVYILGKQSRPEAPWLPQWLREILLALCASRAASTSEVSVTRTTETGTRPAACRHVISTTSRRNSLGSEAASPVLPSGNRPCTPPAIRCSISLVLDADFEPHDTTMSGPQKTAIVTGASQGIGAGIVKGSSPRGFNVVANSRKITQSTEVDGF